MKTKEYAVSYSVTIEHEAIVEAKSEREAKEKVTEVIGEPLKIVSVHTLRKDREVLI
jgi:hypothetical protein